MTASCKTCRYWNAHSIDMKLGDCMSPDGYDGGHRYWRVRTPDMPPGTYALMDSFGRTTTKPHEVCGAYDNPDAKERTAPEPFRCVKSSCGRRYAYQPGSCLSCGSDVYETR